MTFDSPRAYVTYYLQQFLEPMLRDPATTPAQREALLEMRRRLEAPASPDEPPLRASPELPPA